jgi:hypothetical protein
MRKIILILGLILLPTISFGATYGSNLTSSITTCSTKSDMVGTCASTYDANTATYWQSNDVGYPVWIKYTLSSAKSIDKLEIYAMSDGGGKMMTNFDLQYSDDNSTWTTASSSVITVDNTWQTFIYNTATTTLGEHLYWQISITESRSDSLTYSGFAELNAFSCTDCISSTSTATSTTLGDNEMINEYLMLFLDIIFIGSIIAGLIWIQSKF